MDNLKEIIEAEVGSKYRYDGPHVKFAFKEGCNFMAGYLQAAVPLEAEAEKQGEERLVKIINGVLGLFEPWKKEKKLDPSEIKAIAGAIYAASHPSPSDQEQESQGDLWEDLWADISILNKLIIGGYDREADEREKHLRSKYTIIRKQQSKDK